MRDYGDSRRIPNCAWARKYRLQHSCTNLKEPTSRCFLRTWVFLKIPHMKPRNGPQNHLIISVTIPALCNPFWRNPPVAKWGTSIYVCIYLYIPAHPLALWRLLRKCVCKPWKWEISTRGTLRAPREIWEIHWNCRGPSRIMWVPFEKLLYHPASYNLDYK